MNFTKGGLITILLLALTTLNASAINFAGGTGVLNDPYLIETTQQFEEIKNHRNKYFKLTKDLDFSSYDGNSWWPVGEWGSGDRASERFSGVFDGAGYAIKNLVVDRKSYDYSIFGVADGATIKNLLVVDCEIRGEGRLGILVGAAFRTTIEQVGVINSKCLNVYSGPHAGGITGPLYESSISNSYVFGGEVFGGDGVGGISAIMESGSSITNCYASCSVEGTVNVGGLAGYASSASISNSIALNSKITCHDVNDGRIAGIIHGEKKLSNNYAGEGVMINNTPTTTDVAADEKSGESVSNSDLATIDFYANKAKFAILKNDEQIWGLNAEVFDYPVFKWQLEDMGTSIVEDGKRDVKVYVENQNIHVEGLRLNDIVNIYTIGGALLSNMVVDSSEIEIPMNSADIAIVHIISENSIHSYKVMKK